MNELEEGIMRVLAGPEKKTRIISEKEKAITAYHEMGHALVGHFLEYTDPVHKISVVSRGQALGYTISLPTEDKFLTTKQELMDTLSMTLGGRAAEEVVFGEITTGAANDLEKATSTAKQMIMRYGMSEELGPRTLGHDQSMPFLGREFQQQADYSEEIARQIDDEIRRIIEEAHQRAKDLLTEKRELLDRISKILIHARDHRGGRVPGPGRRRAGGRSLPRARREGSAQREKAARRSAEKRQRQAAAGAQAGARQPGQPRGHLTAEPAPRTRGPGQDRTGVRLLLEGIGEDPDRPGLRKTPQRVADMYEDIFSGLAAPDPSELLVSMPGDHHQEMVLIRDIDFYSVCEHHLLPFHGLAHVAYIPSRHGHIAGLCKLARVVRKVAARPQLQERITTRWPTPSRRPCSPRARCAHRGRTPVHEHARRAHAGRQDRHQRRARHHPDATRPRGPRSSPSSTRALTRAHAAGRADLLARPAVPRHHGRRQRHARLVLGRRPLPRRRRRA